MAATEEHQHPERSKRPLSIRALLVVLVVVELGLLALVVGFSVFDDSNEERAGASARADESAATAAELIAEAVDETEQMLAAEARLPGYGAVFADPSSCTLTGSGNDVFASGHIHIVRGDGSVGCTSTKPSGGLPGRGYAGQSWLRELDEPGTHGPVDDPVLDTRALIVVAPIETGGGAIVLSLPLSGLGRGLDERLGRTTDAPAFVVMSGDRSTEIARSPGPTYLDSLDGTAYTRPLAEPVAIFRGADGRERIFGAARVPDLGWHVYAGLATREALAGASDTSRNAVFLLLTLGVILVLVARSINSRIVKPVRELAEAADAVSGRGEDGDLRVKGPAELVLLGERLQNMLDVRRRAEKVLEESLQSEREAAERLRAVDEMKTAFLYAVSHELRTPLTAIVGFAELLDRQLGELSPADVSEHVSAIRVNAGRLERLLLDLLDVDRLSRGVVEPRRRPTNMEQLIRRVLEHSVPDENVSVNVDPGTVAFIDPSYVERVVEHLVVGAVKSAPPGTPVEISVTRSADEILLCVDDYGPDIPDALKETVFEPFARQPQQGPRPGVGIELTLVARFAQLHGGRAWVEDRPGGGASFRVLLPAAERQPSAVATTY